MEHGPAPPAGAPGLPGRPVPAAGGQAVGLGRAPDGGTGALAGLAAAGTAHRRAAALRGAGAVFAAGAAAVAGQAGGPVCDACGHALAGLAVIVLAKLASAAIVARIYVLTRPALLTLAWFARLETWFLALKERAIARLEATAAWQQLRHLMAAMRRGWRHWQEQRRGGGRVA